jgi:hypothetical protein
VPGARGRRAHVEDRDPDLPATMTPDGRPDRHPARPHRGQQAGQRRRS